MRRFALLASLLLLCCNMAAQQQELLSSLKAKLESNRISVNFSCSPADATEPATIKGKLTAQQNCYRVITKDLEVYCDGESVWTVYPQSKEVYIEKAGEINEFFEQADYYLQQIKNLKYDEPVLSMPGRDLGLFRYDCSSASKDWVITDLR